MIQLVFYSILVQFGAFFSTAGKMVSLPSCKECFFLFNLITFHSALTRTVPAGVQLSGYLSMSLAS